MKYNHKLADLLVHTEYGDNLFFNGIDILTNEKFSGIDGLVGYGVNDKYGREIGRYYTIVEATCTPVPEGTPWNDSRPKRKSMYIGTKFQVSAHNTRDGQTFGSGNHGFMFFDTLEEAIEGCRKDYNKHKATTVRKAAKA